MFQGLKLTVDESVPDQIRLWMARNLLRVRDVFLQFDDDDNGRIDVDEFRQAMYQMGFDGLDDALVAGSNAGCASGCRLLSLVSKHRARSTRQQDHPVFVPVRNGKVIEVNISAGGRGRVQEHFHVID